MPETGAYVLLREANHRSSASGITTDFRLSYPVLNTDPCCDRISEDAILQASDTQLTKTSVNDEADEALERDEESDCTRIDAGMLELLREGSPEACC